MSTCENCSYFFPIPKEAEDFEVGNGDCVSQKKDEKGQYWLSKPAFGPTEACSEFQKK